MDKCQNLVINIKEIEKEINEDEELTMGQSESKKNSKRTGLETKGTAMSFGFRKKLQTPKKKNNLLHKEDKEIKETTDIVKNHNSPINEDKYHSETVILNSGLKKADDKNNDNNGNLELHSNKKRESRKLFQIRNVPSRHEIQGNGGFNNTSDIDGNTVGTYKQSRFGFRSTNTIRPASTGITLKMTDFNENVENNYVSVGKRRSKSAHGARTLASYRCNDQQQMNEIKNQNPKINPMYNNNYNNNFMKQQRQQQQLQHEYKQYNEPSEKKYNVLNTVARNQNSDSSTKKDQCTIVNTGLHTNFILKPTPQPAVSVSKFTLHTTSLPKPQYPVPISLTTVANQSTMDAKNTKHAINSTRKGFSSPRDISIDSGVSSLENTSYDNGGGIGTAIIGKNSPKKLNRGRQRNLEMVISGRHKFEIRDLDDSLSCDSIEPLALPKLPSLFSSNDQTVLPLSGLIRSNTVLSREPAQNSNGISHEHVNRTPSDVGSVEEEKLNRDRSTSEKSTKNSSLKDYNISSKNSSPGSSRASWCNAGESLAIKDCSSLSLSSSDESKDQQNEKTLNVQDEIDICSITINDNQIPKSVESNVQDKLKERPSQLCEITETKFAEMAAAVDVFLDDETSPTDSLVSGTDSDDIILKKSKKKSNEKTQEKYIDEISPEIEVCSPLSPGTPTHASNSLSDIGRDFLIDDEISDQPALVFSDKADAIESTPQRQSLTETPTLRDADLNKSPALSSRKSLIHAAIELSLRTPISLRKAALLNRTESLDTLSPCESIASDDLMMDYECHSSLDSIDRKSFSLKSQNGSILQNLDDTQIFSELEAKGTEMIREWSNILKLPKQAKENKPNSQLPARATRLLNRSRLQPVQLSYGSDSPKSIDSISRKPTSSRPSSHLNSFCDPNSSSDDLMIHDKSFRNSMIQDVLYFKKQLMRLRRVLQETDTLNPFEIVNGQFFPSYPGLENSNQNSDEKGLNSITLSSIDDPLEELADLRRQVVYLQGQVEDRERTIRIQKNLIDKLESERNSGKTSVSTAVLEKECINTATQTDRVKSFSITSEGLKRNKSSECTSFTTHFPITCPASLTKSATATSTTNHTSRRHTIISTTFTNLNHMKIPQSIRRASIGWENITYKPVKTTLIGDPINDYQQNSKKLSSIQKASLSSV